MNCIGCRAPLDVSFKACPSCGEPITPFLREYLGKPVGGNYELTRFLARGGMGEVYKARHIHLNADCVIKVMRPARPNERDLHERFIREARLARQIHHPNVALLYDFSVLPDGTYYMVWEFIDGHNLAQILAGEGALDPAYAAGLAIQVLHGLEAIHRAGVVHRDISPDNIVIRDTPDGPIAKIIDLGIAKGIQDAGNSQTATGVFIGKLRYASPDQLGALRDGERIDGRSDLYSLGLVLYEMLAGKPAFQATSAHRYFAMQLHEQPTSLMIPGLDPVLAKATAKDRDERFANAREFANALAAALPSVDTTLRKPDLSSITAPSPLPKETTTARTATRTRTSSSRYIIAVLPIAAILVSITIVSTYVVIWQQRRETTTTTAATATHAPVTTTSTATPTTTKQTQTTDTAPMLAAAPQHAPEERLLSKSTPLQQAARKKTPTVTQPIETTTTAAIAIETAPEETAAAQAVEEPQPALTAAVRTAPYLQPGAYENWQKKIGQVEIVHPFALSSYRELAVLPVDTSTTVVKMSGIASIDPKKLFPETRTLLLENMRRQVGGHVKLAEVDAVPSTAGTLVLRLRLVEYGANAAVTSVIQPGRGVNTSGRASAYSAVAGELVDAPTGTVLVRFRHSRTGSPSAKRLFMQGPDGLVRNSLRAVGDDIGFLITSF